MKRIFLLSICGLSFFACSVDSNELDLNANEIQELNATLNVEGCETTIENFGDAGSIEVSNDLENLYVRILAAPGYDLVDTKLHIANTLEEFPITGKGSGNLPPGQMAFQESNPDKSSYLFTLSLSNYDQCFLIASNTTFTKDGLSQNYWAGEQAGTKANWSYFEYCKQECSVSCESVEGLAGEDNTSTVMAFSEVEGWTYDQFVTFAYSLLDEDVPTDGDFDPSLEDIYASFQHHVQTGEFSSTYTLTRGECTDSVLLGATITE